MDSPRILINQSDSFYSRLILFFSKLEMYFYKKIKNPDCIVQLELSKDMAVLRNKSRTRKIKNLLGTYLNVILKMLNRIIIMQTVIH